MTAEYTENAEFIAGDGTHSTGRAQIGRYLASALTVLPKGTRFITTITSIKFIDREVALLVASGGFAKPGAQAPDRHGIQTMLAVREAGVWRAALFQRTRILPQDSSGQVAR